MTPFDPELVHRGSDGRCIDSLVGTCGQLDDTIASCEVAAVQVRSPVVASPVPVEVPGSPFALSGPASVSQISEVPTAFGGLRSVVSNDGGPATSAKPGKEISKDHGRGFSGYPTLKAHTRFFSFRANVLLVLVRVKKVKTLKPSYFVSGVVGTFVGFPRHKRVVDGFARCLLCKADLSIAGRGLSSLWEHWRGVEHTRLEQKYRVMMQMPLLDKACRPVTAEEDRRIRQDRMNEPPVYLESELSWSVDERIAIEEAEASHRRGQRCQRRVCLSCG